MRLEGIVSHSCHRFGKIMRLEIVRLAGTGDREAGGDDSESHLAR